VDLKGQHVALTQDQERQYFDELERMGETQVRSDLDHGRVSPAYVYLASQWLSEKEREAKGQKQASLTEQMEHLRRAADAAERQAAATEQANTRATLALVISIASMAVTTIVALWVAH
jgi:thioredoxin-like negative regulator of GroEL